jgi:protein TonB
LLILAFVGLNFRPSPDAFKGGGSIATFDVSADSGAAERADAPRPTTPDDVTPPRPTPPITPPKIVLPERPIDLPFVPMDKKTMDAGNIAALGSNAPGYVAKKGGSAPGDSEMVGNAPNGEPLYAAEWYREPTDVELSGYLPKNFPEGGGYGLVACRTASQYRVEDCVELENFPRGSRLAGAVRQAAWQFKVRPPRVGGRPLIGTWVRIRIDYLPAERRR